MKKGWDRYATEKRYIQKGYLRKYQNGNPSWKTPETSCCDRVQQSREEIEKTIEWFGRVVELTEEVVPNEPFSAEEALALSIYKQALIDNQDLIIKEMQDESEVGIGSPVQSSGEGCSEVRSQKPRSRSGRGGNGKVRKNKDGKDGSSRKKEG